MSKESVRTARQAQKGKCVMLCLKFVMASGGREGERGSERERGIEGERERGGRRERSLFLRQYARARSKEEKLGMR